MTQSKCMKPNIPDKYMHNNNYINIKNHLKPLHILLLLYLYK